MPSALASSSPYAAPKASRNNGEQFTATMTVHMATEDITQRRLYARRVMSNPTDHFLEDQHIDHPDVQLEWIEAAIIDPYYQESDSEGNQLFYGSVPGRRRWLKVVVVNDQIHTAYFDRRLTLRLGEPA